MTNIGRIQTSSIEQDTNIQLSAADLSQQRKSIPLPSLQSVLIET